MKKTNVFQSLAGHLSEVVNPLFVSVQHVDLKVGEVPVMGRGLTGHLELPELVNLVLQVIDDC